MKSSSEASSIMGLFGLSPNEFYCAVAILLQKSSSRTSGHTVGGGLHRVESVCVRMGNLGNEIHKYCI